MNAPLIKPGLGQPHGLWSLWDIMINFNLTGVCFIIQALYREEELRAAIAGTTVGHPSAMIEAVMGEEAAKHFYVSGDDKDRISGMLKYATALADQLQLQSVHDRIELFSKKMMFAEFSHQICVAELRALREAFESGIQFVRLYIYPKDKVGLLIRLTGDWASVLKSFPSLAQEIDAGVDCYAFNRNAACVFHMMRIAEIGMRALAHERQVSFPKQPLEWAEWENIIDQIESKAKGMVPTLAKGPERDAARAFYTAAVAQLRALKEVRNRVMHMRGDFDELDAQRTINQVRDFMNGLSSKIGEKTRRPIRKWP
jgi:hypothetical protein